MSKSRKTVLLLVRTAATLLAAVIIVLVLKQEPEVRQAGAPQSVQPGEPQTVLQAQKNARLMGAGAGFGFLPMYEERTEDKLAIYRLNPEGNLEKIGEHAGERIGAFFMGTDKYYGLTTRGTDGGLEVYVYRAGKQMFKVPTDLIKWGERLINPLVVLPNGNLFAIYGSESFGMRPSYAAIIQFDSEEGPRRHDLYSGEGEFRYVLSGDGSVVSIIAEGTTSLYSGEDGRLIKRIENFKAPAMSYDGRTIIGVKGEDIAVYRDGQLAAETPLGERFFFIRLSMNGSYAALVDKPWETLQVLETRSLQPVREHKVTPGYDRIIDWTVSSDGKVALLERKRSPAGTRRSSVKQRKLLIYDNDGSLLFQREFEPSDFLPVSGMTWSLDGSCLIYQLAEQNRVVRLVFRPQGQSPGKLGEN